MFYLLLLSTKVPATHSAEQVSVADEEIPEMIAEHSLKKCCIGNALMAQKTVSCDKTQIDINNSGLKRDAEKLCSKCEIILKIC